MGWSNGSIFFDHMKLSWGRGGHVKGLLRQTQLILDSYESHLLIPTISVARENGIVLFTLLPCTSQKLQPSHYTILVCIKQHNAYRNDLMLSDLGKHAICGVAVVIGEY